MQGFFKFEGLLVDVPDFEGHIEGIGNHDDEAQLESEGPELHGLFVAGGAEDDADGAIAAGVAGFDVPIAGAGDAMGRKSGLSSLGPNQGKTIGTPPRMGFLPSKSLCLLMNNTGEAPRG